MSNLRFISFLCSFAAAAVAWSQQAAWTPLEAMPAGVEAGERWIRPARFAAFQLDDAPLKAHLGAVPMEAFPLDFGLAKEVVIPRPDGGFGTFRCFESPVMEPGLAAQFPEIRTYMGQGVDDPAAIVRFDVTPQGFHALVLSPNGDYWVDPYTKGDTTHYASYYRRDYAPQPFDRFFCATEGEGQPVENTYAGRVSGTTLRTYRLACAATGEYTAFHGGTVAQGQAAIVTAINRVNTVYEREFTIRLTLIANNSILVYTNAATDPYTNNDGGAMLSENQSNINTLIGSANYDIGHVFSTGGGGVAGLGVVCSTNNKARGVTGLPSPTGDPFYIDYVCHEIGHQFGASHTFNGTGGSCTGNRSSSSAYEPGSGSSIMAYTGICGADNLQNLADVMFHSRSHEQVITFVTNTATCSSNTATGNSIPAINAGADYNVPIGTPFTASIASSSDANGDTLTYSWEQFDLGAAQALTAADNGASPLFRSFSPVSASSRTFPRLPSVLNGVLVAGEKYPAVARTMNLKCTVRDNRAGGGGVRSDSIIVNVRATATPFAVTSPNTAVSWPSGSTQTVTWDVAGTNASPFSAANVRILLSTDGGNTFPTTLLASTPNDGSESVVLPTVTTNATACRIRVEPVGQIFFDISNVNFTILAPPPPAAPTNVQATPNVACVGSPVSLSATVGAGEEVDWYTSSCGGTFVGTGNPLIVNIPGTQLYRARARRTSDGAVSTTCTNVSVTGVSGLPSAPTNATASRSGFCASDSGTITLSATGGSGGTIQWYADVCGGTPVGGNNVVIDSPAQTTTYFARSENLCGASACLSTTVIVNQPPDAPTGATVNRNDFCASDSGTITLSAIGGSGAYTWFAGSCSGASIGSGASLIIDSPETPTTYFVRCENTCGFSACASVAVSIAPGPQAPTSAGADRSDFCASDAGTVTLTATGGSGDTLRWFTGSCGGDPIGTGNNLVIDSPTLTAAYFARWENDCGLSDCASFTLTVNPGAAIASIAVTGSAPFIFGTGGQAVVMLSSPAPAGGSTASVTSSAFSPVVVTVAAGETSGFAPVTFTALGSGQTASADAGDCASGSAVSAPFDVILLPETFVNTAGDNTNRGDTPASPVRDIAVALARTAPSGTVHLAPGAYAECVGTASAVTIAGDPAGVVWAGPCEPTITALAPLSLRDIAFARSGGGGRALLIGVGASADALRCTFSGHSAPGDGGAILANGTISMRDCTISGNAAAGGGGGAALLAGGTLTNCTISGNTAVGAGGGLAAVGGPVTLLHCTIAFNNAAGGGGIVLSGGSAAPSACIVSNNTAGSGPDVLGELHSGGHNLIGDAAGASGLTGTDLTGADAALEPLADNGGPTRTHALGAGSAAIDAASPGACDPDRDQRGIERPTDGNGDGDAVCDIGAFEADSGGPPCPADFNQDGGVDGADVDAFFLAWESGDPSADVNADGGIDGGDVDTFFSAWEAGGC